MTDESNTFPVNGVDDAPSVNSVPSAEQQIKSAAQRLGFNLCGIAPAVTPEGYSRFVAWLQAGYHASMSWMSGRSDAYRHPDGVFPGTKSVIAVAMNYRSEDPATDQPRVARYAAGPADYHDVIRARLRDLSLAVQECCPESRTRCVVDTAPLLERDFARLAGLGWFGKNTMLISPRIGSWCFLGAVLTDAELQPDQPFQTDHCGTCTRCLDACPTDAFPEAHVLDASRCISYLTIEHRDQPVDRELRSGIESWVFGCDVCQEVCPWNRFAPESAEPAFQATLNLTDEECRHLLNITEEGFRTRFRGTPLFRTGRAALVRNLAVVLANRRDRESLTPLASCLNDSSALVRGAAAWAIGEIGDEVSVETLKTQREREADREVAAEINSAIQRIERLGQPRI